MGESKYKVAAEVAEEEFERLAVSMDLDTDTSRMGEEERADFEGLKAKLLDAMRQGNLSVDEQGRAVYKPKADDGAPLVFNEPDGAALMAMDGRKKGHDVAKMYAVIAAMTEQPVKRISQLKNRDLKIVLALATFLLAG